MGQVPRLKQWKCFLDFSTREFVGKVVSLGLRSWLLSEQNPGDLLTGESDRGRNTRVEDAGTAIIPWYSGSLLMRLSLRAFGLEEGRALPMIPQGK